MTQHVSNKQIGKSTSSAFQQSLFDLIRKSETFNANDLQQLLAQTYVAYKSHYDLMCDIMGKLTPDDLRPYIDFDLLTIRESQYKVVQKTAETEGRLILRTMATFLDVLEREGRVITRMVDTNKKLNEQQTSNHTVPEVQEE